MSEQPKSSVLTVTCALAALAVIGGVVFGRCLADRQWEPKPRVTITVEVQLSPVPSDMHQ